MSTSKEHQDHEIPVDLGDGWPAGLSPGSDEELAAEWSQERARWKLLALGAIALYMFFIVVLFWGPVWLVAVGPFVLLIIGRLTGIRRLDGDDEEKRQSAQPVSRRTRLFTSKRRVPRSPYWRRKSSGSTHGAEELSGHIFPTSAVDSATIRQLPKSRKKRQTLA